MGEFSHICCTRFAGVKYFDRITYDDEFIYVAAECIGPYIIQSLKRYNPLFKRGDASGLVFDPINELSDSFVFAVNPEVVQLYRFNYGQIKYVTDKRREIKLTMGYTYGSFYNGIRSEFSLAVDYRLEPWGNFSLNFAQNNLEFSGNNGVEQLLLLGPKAEINFSKNFVWTTFMQYYTQNDNFNINSRVQWPCMPMSDLFLVYSDNYIVEYFGLRIVDWF